MHSSGNRGEGVRAQQEEEDNPCELKLVEKLIEFNGSFLLFHDDEGRQHAGFAMATLVTKAGYPFVGQNLQQATEVCDQYRQ